MCLIVETDLMIFKYAEITTYMFQIEKIIQLKQHIKGSVWSLNLRRKLGPIWKLDNLFSSWSNKSISLLSIIFMVL